MFYAGDAVVPDYARAATYFLKSAAQGVAFSHFFLGMIYAGGGPGVQADSIKAYMWLSLAGELKNRRATVTMHCPRVRSSLRA